MIICEKVSKRFGEKFAVRDVSFRFDKSLAVLGYNGAGKSTLAKLIAGILKPSSGRIEVFGKDPYKCVEVRRKIGIVTHNPMLYRELTVEENLRFFANLFRIEEWDWILDELNLRDKSNKRVLELSRGYLQRVAIARAMISNPHLLILDEAFSSLDLEGREILRKMIRNFEGSILLSTHDLEEAKFCGKFLVLHNGEAAYFGESYDEAVGILRAHKEGSEG
ncbi:MAG: ABC transporter ATP-binding protein [Archaeoglobales archaeon]|nr:ABC transporter ATP-binding protein [Archaeoglobus sp.]NHW89373.1 ABC transporter ATP-binding protein [Archaeoglobales archaeon]